MINILPFISTLCIVISAILVAIGWKLIVTGNKKTHQRTMITAAIFALLFFIIYISRTIFIGNTSFGGPDDMKKYYIPFLIFHIFLAVSGVIFGAVNIIYALKGQFRKHKKLGPWTAMLWFFAASTGVTVYFLLYLIWEPGPVTNMMKAILGIVVPRPVS
jgi:putative membrane protein